MDTVCRLYEVGRQRLAEDEEDEEEDQVRNVVSLWLSKASYSSEHFTKVFLFFLYYSMF